MAFFKKYCSLKIGTQLFTYPPFSIEFEQTLNQGTPATTKVRLYNPNSDTIKAAEGKPKGKTKQYPEIQIDAGFEDDHGLVCVGEINDFKVSRPEADTILELTVGDITGDYANLNIGKTFNNMNMGSIMESVIKEAGKVGKVVVGKIKNIKSYTAGNFKDTLQNLATESGSVVRFKNNEIHVEPEDMNKRSIAYISPVSGLIGGIEKDSKGYRFKTVFMYNVGGGDVVQIEDNYIEKINVKIVEGKKTFSTFGNSDCEFRAI